MLCALVAWSIACLTTSVEAAAFRHVPYDGYGDAASVQHMDIHTPARPGPHPVLAVYDDTLAAEASARIDPRVFNDAGYVVALVRTRTDVDAAPGDLANALRWLSLHVSSYGGDRQRMSLLASGTAAAHAATVFTNASRLAAYGLTADMVQSLILLDAQALLAQGANWPPTVAGERAFPSVLALYDNTVSSLRAQALRFTTQLSASGWSARAQAWNRDGGAQDAPVAARSAEVAAWLASLEVPRIARYDAVSFALAPQPAQALVQLLGADGVLLARGGGNAGQVLVLDAPDAEWRVEQDFGAQGLQVRWIGVLPQRQRQRVVALLEDEGAYYLSLRDGSGAHWSAPRRVESTLPGAVAPSVLAEPGTGQWQLILDQRVLRLSHKARERSWVAQPDDWLAPGRIVATATGTQASFILVDGADAAVLYARTPGAAAWRVWTRWPGARAQALSVVASGAAEYALAAFEGGRVSRIDARAPDRAQWEFDAALALRAHWGALDTEVGVAAHHFTALTQPRTGERVHALPLRVRAPASSGLPTWADWYITRQSDGSYAVGMLDPGPDAADAHLAQVLATPFAADRGRALYALREGAAVVRGDLREAAPTHGLWRRRGHHEQGLVLEPLSEGWLVLLYSFDPDGAPVWYFAQGTVTDGTFVADERGLARYVTSWDESSVVRRDAERSGAIGIEFDAAQCAHEQAASAPTAAVRLSLGGIDTQWCVDAARRGGSDAATLAANGVWFGGIGDQGWGIAIDAEGDVGAARERVLLFYHDAQGEPRWAAGEGARGVQRSEQALWHLRGACAQCTESATAAPSHAGSVRHDIAALCGVREGRFDVVLDQFDGTTQFRRHGAGIQRLTSAACY